MAAIGTLTSPKDVSPFSYELQIEGTMENFGLFLLSERFSWLG